MTAINALTKRFLIFVSLSILVFACIEEESKYEEPGISKELADSRFTNISEVKYSLRFDIPENQSESIPAQAVIKFDYKQNGKSLLFDFNSDPQNIKKIIVNDEETSVEVSNEHIYIDESLLQDKNEIKIDFIAGDQSLNRNPDYLYTLFVPDRASTCFPVFDQPNLKATFDLTLSIPTQWEAIANGEVIDEKIAGDSKILSFKETKPISTYLFAFTAGKFKKVTNTINGRKMTMLHRETDAAKLERNLDKIFDWHYKSLVWLEDYTAIDHPFDKMDFALIPSFQYGGMEHPGAIFYKASSLFLDQSATLNQQLGRARLIAHEVSHMWFGNLVTIEWFDDVWLKEVFANFMAAKIVDPQFPDINHDLKFVLSHYPSAYEVDRSMGTHPIKQELENLKDAGSLYGSIIYQKAPVVMKMLEENIGEDAFQAGIRDYLQRYSYSNASWTDLLEILSKQTNYNIDYWNDKWVMTPGMPIIMTTLRVRNDKIKKMRLNTFVPGQEKAYVWPQQLKVLIGFADSTTLELPAAIGEEIDTVENMPAPEILFTNAGGKGYGYFRLGPNSKKHFLSNIGQYDELLRGALWLNYYELLLREEIDPQVLMQALIKNLPTENNNLITEYMLDVIETIYWRIYTSEQRLKLAPQLEGLLLSLALGSEKTQLMASYFNTLQSVVITEGGVDLLMRIWDQEMEIEGLQLSENDYTKLAYALALRYSSRADSILNVQYQRISNPDKQRQFDFIKTALSANQQTRDDFFESLKDKQNRENEAWVLESLSYLHHPLRANQSLKYIEPSLDLLEEIRLTGDIFFPKRWLEKTLGGHSSDEAKQIVRQFLFRNNSYPKDLKNKILQSADLLFRVVDIKENYKSKAEEAS
ncbi:peptidase M1 [Fulvivirga sp. RKSG066]|uniref:M1 family metallopeptidase n=1 Tax=Fulvivirga aurantia TaxID=2529383 RepID=UPI0012BC9590|nr:M1 family aminopeptidase [Fulvivirga aurantia]MTI20334.1 peptidase M1 [Fulvivirga aurantia]